MALDLALGVCQITLSTPGVFLPRFSVTRFTAKALAAKEWVSSRCKAFTLPQRPSRVALTMRACSLLTWRSHCGQSSCSQCGALPEDAHMDDSMFICDFLLRRFYQLSRHERPAGSQPACAA